MKNFKLTLKQTSAFLSVGLLAINLSVQSAQSPNPFLQKAIGGAKLDAQIDAQEKIGQLELEFAQKTKGLKPDSPRYRELNEIKNKKIDELTAQPKIVAAQAEKNLQQAIEDKSASDAFELESLAKLRNAPKTMNEKEMLAAIKQMFIPLFYAKMGTGNETCLSILSMSETSLTERATLIEQLKKLLPEIAIHIRAHTPGGRAHSSEAKDISNALTAMVTVQNQLIVTLEQYSEAITRARKDNAEEPVVRTRARAVLAERMPLLIKGQELLKAHTLKLEGYRSAASNVLRLTIEKLDQAIALINKQKLVVDGLDNENYKKTNPKCFPA